jgi:hypothetical protein
MDFFVEGRYFANTLYAFTFAQIQADRMNRVVEVHSTNALPANSFSAVGGGHKSASWHATAHPSNFVRRHLVPEQ